ncbi:MAG: hypothetical protein ABJZ83_12835 [Yoonia sp.]|uniref:hypothetical protein n=1 Tax=Yoonia sp. TaxID=2212373 RepID=UPI003299257D
MTQSPSMTHMGYDPGHCWYYLLGGKVLSPKQIKLRTLASGYKGYAAEDIGEAHLKAEPKRSSALRHLKAKFETDLKRDISRYRECALALHRFRKANPPLTERPKCANDVHMNISLKHNHIVNDFAHLIYLNELLNQQGDLFSF